MCGLVLPVSESRKEVGVKEVPGENMRYFVIKDRMKTYVPCMIQFYAKWIPEKVISWVETLVSEPSDHTEPENLITEIYIPVQ